MQSGMAGEKEQAGSDVPAAQALARIAQSDPIVVAQLGQSLDGRIATPSGESRYINGEAGLDHLHRLRAQVDAIVVGAGTIEIDDPQLTVRRCAGRSPARIVIDPRGRLAGKGRWLADDGAPRLVIAGAPSAPPPGAETIVLAATGGNIPPKDIVRELQRRGFRRLLIEGGARTISGFIDAGVVDRLHLIVACTIIGSGRTGLDLAPLARLGDALRPPTDVYRLDDHDTLFDCDLHSARGGRGGGEPT
jgi:diaminohydroxyphosphoribosylaminopyrimidine deaminase / 5-amino-6-(5-phosphoribosylamino)uracil reductase